jgi:hypothetical protein
MKVHPTFYVSFLKPYYRDEEHPGRNKVKRAPVTVRKELDKEVEDILDHRVLGYSKMNRRTEYLVKRKDLPESEATWEKDVTLWQYEDLIRRYRESHTMRASNPLGGGGLLDP